VHIMSIYVHCVLKQIISFDELKTDYKNPIDQCNSLNPVSRFACVSVSVLLSSLLIFSHFLCIVEIYCFELFATKSR